MASVLCQNGCGRDCGKGADGRVTWWAGLGWSHQYPVKNSSQDQPEGDAFFDGLSLVLYYLLVLWAASLCPLFITATVNTLSCTRSAYIFITFGL